VKRPTRVDLERLAAESVKRVFAADEDWTAPPGTQRMLAFCETETIWPPVATQPSVGAGLSRRSITPSRSKAAMNSRLSSRGRA
jgi:hypothetical protein